MKKILFTLVLLSLNTLLYSQNYEFGAISTSNLTVKSEGKIKINEKTVIIEAEDKIYNYDFVKKTNGIIYFTDGIMTHFLTILKQKGKKKGFEYDFMINYNMDKNQGGLNIIYWSKEIK